MQVLSHSDQSPTGHNDLNVDEQPNLKKASPLRGSKFILSGDNITSIMSCMTSGHPTHTLHPIMGTASAHLARRNMYHATYCCQTANTLHYYCSHLQHCLHTHPASMALQTQALPP